MKFSKKRWLFVTAMILIVWTLVNQMIAKPSLEWLGYLEAFLLAGLIEMVMSCPAPRENE